MWFLSCVSTHVNHKHVLSLERFLFPWTVFPSAYKWLLICMNVIRINVLKMDQTKCILINISSQDSSYLQVTTNYVGKSRAYFDKLILSWEFNPTVRPVAVSFNEIPRLIFHRITITPVIMMIQSRRRRGWFPLNPNFPPVGTFIYFHSTAHCTHARWSLRCYFTLKVRRIKSDYKLQLSWLCRQRQENSQNCSTYPHILLPQATQRMLKGRHIQALMSWKWRAMEKTRMLKERRAGQWAR